MTADRREWRGAARRPELLDDPVADGDAVVASLRDVARANRFLGGAAAPLQRLDELLRSAAPGATLTLLDVGTGDGDLPRAARVRAARQGLRLRLLGVERHPAAARHAARGGDIAVSLADAASLPFASRSVDLVLCSQLLHHYRGPALTAIVTELGRVARLGVVIAELRPSPIAAAGLWLASYPLRFRPVSRRDGVTSVLRGFTAAALRRVCAEAGVRAEVRSHALFRVTAAWRAGGNGARATEGGG